MKYPSEEQIINYIYGELSGEEKKQMDDLISNNPELKKEVEELSLMRTHLGNIEDQEVVEPAFFNPTEAPKAKSITLRQMLWNPVSGIAATLLLLFMAAVLFNVQVRFNGGEMAFGSGTEQQEFLTAEEVQMMINTAMKDQVNGRQDEDLDYRLTSFEKDQADEMNRLFEQQNSINQEMLEAVIAKLQNDNMVVIERFLKLSQDQQEQYMQTVLADFSRYIETQRQKDLDQIEEYFVSLEQNQNVRNQETEEVLAGIISTVNNQYLNE